jgi:hypothetical protein
VYEVSRCLLRTGGEERGRFRFGPIAEANEERDRSLGGTYFVYRAFRGGPPSPYITTYILQGFAQALEFKVESP